MTEIFTAPTWRVPRESHEFVGPITVTVKVSGEPVTLDPDAIKFAVLADGQRPVDDDWANPVIDPDDPDAIGVAVTPVAAFARYGIWAQLTIDSYEVVLDPDQVGWVERP